MKRTDLKNNVKVVGELVSKVVRRNNEGKEDETLSLETIVKVSEVEQHTILFFAYKYGKGEDGKRVKDKDKISKLFTGYETVIDEFKTAEDENGDGIGERVEIKGSLSMNRYVDKNTEQIKEFSKIKGTFCSRVKEGATYKPCAVWEAHMHITGLDEEKSDVTGQYVLVKGMVVDYLEDEFEFRIYSEKVKKGFLKKFDKFDSARLEGRIVNRPDEAVAVEVEDDEDDWGDEMEVSAGNSTIIRNYLEIITGDKKPMDTDDEDHPLNEGKIKEYKKNIAKRKSDTIAKYQEKKTSEQKGANKIDPNKGVADDEDIPF